MDTPYCLRRASGDTDCTRLKDFCDTVFHPEPVGCLAETLIDYLSQMPKRGWFMAEERQSSEIASGLALIPWEWTLAGVRLKVAEMGLVGISSVLIRLG